MKKTTAHATAALLAIGGAYLILRVALIPIFSAPHWIGHLAFVPMPWLFVTATSLMTRDHNSRIYRTAKLCFLIWAVEDTSLTIIAIAWEGVMARGDIPPSVHTVELAMTLGYLGATLLGIGLLRSNRLRRWAGAALLASLITDLTVLPWAAGAGTLIAAASLLAPSPDQSEAKPA